MTEPLNVKGIITDAAARLQRQRDAARQVSEDIANARRSEAPSEPPTPPEGQS